MFANAKPFWDSGLALVNDAQSLLWGLIDGSGKYISEPIFSNVGDNLRNGLFRVGVLDRGWGYIDTSGAFVIEPQFEVANDFSNGFARVSSQIQSIENQNYYRLWGYINTSGERITEDIFSEAHDFSLGFAQVKRGDPFGDWEYIDMDGNIASPDKATSYTVVRLSREHDAETGLTGYVDSNGNWVIPQCH